jgi:hypothetical protein
MEPSSSVVALSSRFWIVISLFQFQVIFPLCHYLYTPILQLIFLAFDEVSLVPPIARGKMLVVQGMLNKWVFKWLL